MIIGILSDTHGSVSGWKDALKIFERENAELILHCGDILEPFAQTASPLRRALNESPISVLAVMGNMDTPRDLELLDFPVVPLVLIQDGAMRIAAAHGNHYADQHAAYRHARSLGAQVFVRGHTHSPQIEKMRGVYMLNPGSAAQPRGRELRPTVIVLSPDAIRLYAIHTGEVIKEVLL